LDWLKPTELTPLLPMPRLAPWERVLALNVPSEGYYRTPMRTNSDIYVLICTEIYKIMSLLPQKLFFSWPGLSDLSGTCWQSHFNKRLIVIVITKDQFDSHLIFKFIQRSYK
jgi:hypothetical protein